jgi:hypothetical protein
VRLGRVHFQKYFSRRVLAGVHLQQVPLLGAFEHLHIYAV